MAESHKIQNVASEMVPPLGNQGGSTLAVSSSAVSFAEGSLPSACKYVRLQVQTDSVYVTYDGTTPSGSNGELVQATQTAVFSRGLVLRMKFIRTATDAKVFAQPCNFLAQ